MASDTLTRHTHYDDLPEYLTAEECRTYLALSRGGMYDLLRRGEIPHRRFGRVIRIPKTALVDGLSPVTPSSMEGRFRR
jgi:excisionase family DNA binding protein